ncbi:uncharacterized protein [Asterias amurensis]|uniref:uncharacterized protein n=1 Tax=Asterias amurensis TaxID=7602 RepID=UPI003AB8D0C9
MSEIFRGRIKEIVRGSDLAKLSSKKIREQLEEEFKTDLSNRKKEIDDIVMALIVSESQSEQSQNATADDSGAGNISKSSKQKKKKKSKHKDKPSNSHKRKHKDADSPKAKISKNSTQESEEEESETANDEEFARMLQEEEDDENEDVGRRGLRTRRKPTKTSKTKEPRKTPTKSMFQKEMVLSPELADIMGTDRMPRSEVVKKMWEIVKERDLRDPSNKQYHICDDQLMKVFGIRRVRTFSMMKYLKTHVKDPALLTDS